MIPALIAGLLGLLAGGVGAWLWARRPAAAAAATQVARADLERERAELRLRTREEFETWRRELDLELRERRTEVQRGEERLTRREAALDARQTELDRAESEVHQQRAELERTAARLAAADEAQRREVERIGGLTAEEARAAVLRRAEEDTRRRAAELARTIEDEARLEAERVSRQLVTAAMERCAVDRVTESSVAVVPLSGDEIKGRIIGREGRNIRSFEQLTGVDLVIDDTPEAVVISAFDPVRREVARMALTVLIDDGRIHPARIEEVVERCRAELEQQILEAGEQAVLEAGVPALPPAINAELGKLRYRTSYAQNVLRHSVEVAHLAGALAVELGADEALARRAGLLHDIGKALDAGLQGPHALLGLELLRQHGESPAVCHAVGSHHHDLEPETVEAVLVSVADTLSAARPGARRDSLERYVQRLERLEALAAEFEGVSKAFAIQAGREIRILVHPEQVDDHAAMGLAHDVAYRIEQELAYPGQIKVTVIREQRAVEFAR